MRHASFSHDLLLLASKAVLKLSDEQQEWLDEITTFNLNARYDNYKQDFHKHCTKEFTDEWIIRIETFKKMVKKSIIDTAVKYLKQIPSDLEVKKAYLFGSYAKGLQNEDSDIDIAIVIGNMPDFFTTQMQLIRLRRNIDLRIEPHPIEESDFTSMNPFAYEIQKSGIEIKIDD